MAHHYVPRFYLKNFTFNSDQSLVYSMNQKSEIHENAISKICAKKNYNSPDEEIYQSKLEKEHSDMLIGFIETPNPENSNLGSGFLGFVSFLMFNNRGC